MSPSRQRGLAAGIVLIIIAVVLVGFAVWLRIDTTGKSTEADRLTGESARLAAEANKLTEGVDVENEALADAGASGKVVEELRPVIAAVLSYNYADLASTERAVHEHVTGKGLCEYEELFGEVKKLAPEQKLVLITKVREIGVSRLAGDSARLVVFIDQTTTRTGQNQTTGSGAQLGIVAERQDGRWKIAQFDFLGQALPNGQPAPQC